ncbi:MAG: ATP-binding cassette domain-containing protein, partial [Polaribacter sp.]
KNDVFILDEPFNGVDIQSNLVISEIIKKLKKLEKTIIISSHIFSTLKDICDEIFLMKNGKIIKKVKQQDFNILETEMMEFTIGNQMERLGLE